MKKFLLLMCMLLIIPVYADDYEQQISPELRSEFEENDDINNRVKDTMDKAIKEVDDRPTIRPWRCEKSPLCPDNKKTVSKPAPGRCGYSGRGFGLPNHGWFVCSHNSVGTDCKCREYCVFQRCRSIFDPKM